MPVIPVAPKIYCPICGKKAESMSNNLPGIIAIVGMSPWRDIIYRCSECHLILRYSIKNSTIKIQKSMEVKK